MASRMKRAGRMGIKVLTVASIGIMAMDKIGFPTIALGTSMYPTLATSGDVLW